MPMEVAPRTVAEYARPVGIVLPETSALHLTADDCVDRVRDLLPAGATDREINDAAAWLAATLNSEDRQYWDANTEAAHAAGLFTLRGLNPRKFDACRGGGIAGINALETPDTVGKSTIRVGRNKKGTTRKVIRTRPAPVIGALDRDANGAPLRAMARRFVVGSDGTVTSEDYLSVAGSMARTLVARAADGTLTRVPGGWSSLAIARATNDSTLSLHVHLDPMVGTDQHAWATVVPGDRSSRCSVARHQTELAGGHANPAVASLVPHVEANGSQTVKRFPTRYTLPMGNRRKGDPTVTAGATVDRFYSGPSDVSAADYAAVKAGTDPFARFGTGAVLPASVVSMSTTRLVAAHVDTESRFVGFSRVDRPAAIVKSTGKRAARTINDAPIVPPTTVAGWSELLAMLNRGERLVCDGVTVTRSAKGILTAADKREGRAHKWQSRTVDSMAIRLA